MTVKKFVVEARTLEEARNQVKLQVPEGFTLVSEQVLEEEWCRNVFGRGGSIAEAFEKAQDALPEGCEVVEKEVVSDAETILVLVEAFTREDAEEKALWQVSEEVSISVDAKASRITQRGSVGFLGIGRKPDTYEVQVVKKAVARLAVVGLVRIEATIEERPSSNA